MFKVHFGLLTLKGYTKGEHVLRFEAIVHNTRTLLTGRILKNFPAIVARLAAMVDRFTNMLDCVDVAFLPDGILDQLPAPSQLGSGRVGGVDINRPRARAALTAVLALAVAPHGFTVGPRRQGPITDRTEPKRVHRPASRLRPAQTACQTTRRQTWKDPALPGPWRGRPHHRRTTGPARRSHLANPRRHPQPQVGSQPRQLDTRRP